MISAGRPDGCTEFPVFSVRAGWRRGQRDSRMRRKTLKLPELACFARRRKRSAKARARPEKAALAGHRTLYRLLGASRAQRLIQGPPDAAPLVRTAKLFWQRYVRPDKPGRQARRSRMRRSSCIAPRRRRHSAGPGPARMRRVLAPFWGGTPQLCSGSVRFSSMPGGTQDGPLS